MTPRSEPDPLLTIDRLVRVRLQPGVSAVANVTLHGACFGTMPTLASLAAGTAAGCVDQEKTLVAVAEVSAHDEGPGQTGTWLAVPCGEPAGVDRVCVIGGGATVGASDQSIVSGGATYKPSVPVRAFGITSFWMDRTEVMVARVRAALAAGYAAAPPRANDGPIVTPSGIDDVLACTYSNTPRGREEYGVTCWTSREARAFCQREGGDLPTEAQWEWVDDDYDDESGPCWAPPILVDRRCRTRDHVGTGRGGFWAAPVNLVDAKVRFRFDGAPDKRPYFMGVRCVRDVDR